MCHSIIILPDHRFYTYFPGLSDYNLYNVGRKEFRVSKNKISGDYNWNVRSCKKTNVGLEIVSMLRKQRIQYPSFPGIFKIQMNLGAHIHSFSSKDGLHPSTLISLGPYYPPCRRGEPYYRLNIPVLFKTKDITFFDGKDVSVSRFVIPSPETMLVIFGEKDLWLNGSKNTPFQGLWRAWHEKLYKEAYAIIPEAVKAMKRAAKVDAAYNESLRSAEQAAIKKQRGTR
jgi:hypothetical protein